MGDKRNSKLADSPIPTCRCGCHVVGFQIMHFAACCNNTYSKYITTDGTAIIPGLKVKYKSKAGRTYDAIITALPDNPFSQHHLPTVSLEFRDNRGKLVRKPRVLHIDAAHNKIQVYSIHDQQS